MAPGGEPQSFRVAGADAGARLDVVLAAHAGLSRAVAQRLIEQGLVKTVRPERRAPRQAPAPVSIAGEPISETIIAERR